MVAPIVGPVVTTLGNSTSPTYESKVSYRQSKPFDRPLPYRRRVGSTTSAAIGLTPHSFNYPAGLTTGFDMISSVDTWDPWYHVENRLYDKFREDLASTASLGVALAELSQSYHMIYGRAMQIATFIRRLRRLDFSGAARTLQMPGPPKGVSTKKKFANNYLEFHFGWSPLIGDIGSAINVLQEPIKSVWVHAKVTEPTRLYHLSDPVTNGNAAGLVPGSYNLRRYWEGRRSASCGAEVAVTNPNLWLANQLGFVNPASIAWELIPFSFVVDWFANVGQVINSYSDFYGLTLSKGWTTRHYKGKGFYLYSGTITWMEWVNGKYVSLYSRRLSTGQGPFTCVDRRVGLPKPTFALKPFRPWGWRRTAAAVSLLAQLHRER